MAGVNNREHLQNALRRYRYTNGAAKTKKGHSACKIKCIETGIIYSSITEAANEIGVNKGVLSNAIIKDKSIKGKTYVKL